MTVNSIDSSYFAEVEECSTPPGTPVVPKPAGTEEFTPGGSRRVERESGEIEVVPPMELEMSCCSPIKSRTLIY